jgi:hypothetical protein
MCAAARGRSIETWTVRSRPGRARREANALDARRPHWRDCRPLQPRRSTTKEPEMKSLRSTAVIVGVLYIVGTVSGVLSVVVTWGLLGSADVLDQVAAHASRVRWGALLVLAMGVSLAMVPAVLFPVLRRLSEPLAVGYVVFRGALETFTYLGVAICWLLLVATAEQHAAAGSAAAAQLEGVGALLVAAQDPIIIAVQNTVFGLGALMLYSLLYQGKLLPRWLSVWGFAGALAYFAAGPIAALTANPVLLLLPLGVQEMVMAVWLIAKGFSPDAVLAAGGEPHALAA